MLPYCHAIRPPAQEESRARLESAGYSDRRQHGASLRADILAAPHHFDKNILRNIDPAFFSHLFLALLLFLP